MQIITSGQPYLDIDGYAGIVAYAELLRAQGSDAIAVSTSPMNSTIPQLLRDLEVDFGTSIIPSRNKRFSVLDTSDPAHFDPIVDLDQVTEVIDHHPGFEKYWAAHPHVHTQIALFGAVCTLIAERWREAGLLSHMSENTAKLLTAGILDNTLNFGASVTTASDQSAYADLAHHANLPEAWPEQYFTACEESMRRDFKTAVTSDTKILDFKTVDQPVCVGQLTVWDADAILQSFQPLISATLQEQSPHWFMNLISLRHRQNRLLTSDPATKTWLSNLLNTSFHGDLAITHRTWLRKEIMHQDISFSERKTS